LQANFLRTVSIKIPLDTAFLCHFEARKRRGTPRLTPRGDKKRARGDSPFLSFRAKREISTPCPAPYPVLPSDSEAYLTSFGMASGMSSRGAQAPRDPSACASGRQKSRLRATKRVRGDNRGLAQKTFLIQPYSNCLTILKLLIL